MIITDALKNFVKRGGFDSAIILSFTTILALVPILFLSMSVFSISDYFAGYKDMAMEFLFAQLLPDSYTIVESYINEFIDKTSNLTGISFSFLLITSILLLFEIDIRVNKIWSDKKRRYWLSGIFSYLFVLFLGPFFLILSLIIGSYLITIDVLGLKIILSYIVPFLLSSIGFILIYYLIPTAKVKFIGAIKGGIIASLILELLRQLVVIYLEYFHTYEIMYGAFSILPLLILWIYVSWMVLLYCASLVYCLDKR